MGVQSGRDKLEGEAVARGSGGKERGGDLVGDGPVGKQRGRMELDLQTDRGVEVEA